MNLEKPPIHHEDHKDDLNDKQMSRRKFLKLAGLSAALLSLNPTEALGAMSENHEKNNFSKLVNEINTLVEQRSFSGLTRTEQLQGLLSLLAKKTKDEYPELTDKIEKYSHGNVSWDEFIKPMTDFFAQRGYFFNVHKVDLNGKFLIPVERKAVPISDVDNRGLAEVFPKDKTEGQSVFVMRDDMFIAQGTTQAGMPVVNQHGKAAEQRLQFYLESMPDTAIWASVTQDNYAQASINNEVAHAILQNEYRFSPQSNHAWSGFDTGLDMKITNSQQAHEFVSDAAAIGTDGRAYAKNIFNALIKKVTAREGVSAEYAFSEEFAMDALRNIYDKKDIAFTELIDEIEELRQAYQTGRFSRDQFQTLVKRTLLNIDMNDLQDIQRTYIQFGKRIIAEIEANK